MKQWLPLLLSGLVWVCTGCARNYNITLSNDKKLSSHGKPKYDKATDTFQYKDSYGRLVSIPAFRVKEIAPK